jgi:hypothetical protein
MSTPKRTVLAVAAMAAAFVVAAAARQQNAPLPAVPPTADVATFAPLAARVDPFVAKPRVIGCGGSGYDDEARENLTGCIRSTSGTHYT